eukprot:jgi/Mesvir1/28769/Mv19734-RA.1
MAPLKLSCEIPMNADVYFRERDCPAFRALLCKTLGMKEMYVMDAYRKDGRHTIKLKTVPRVEIPRSLSKFLGKEEISYIDELAYPDEQAHATKRSIDFSSVPPLFQNKVDIGGTLTIESVGAQTCRQTLEGHVNVDVFGLKKPVEQLIIRSLETTYKQLPAVVTKWVVQRRSLSPEERQPQLVPRVVDGMLGGGARGLGAHAEGASQPIMGTPRALSEGKSKDRSGNPVSEADFQEIHRIMHAGRAESVNSRDGSYGRESEDYPRSPGSTGRFVGGGSSFSPQPMSVSSPQSLLHGRGLDDPAAVEPPSPSESWCTAHSRQSLESEVSAISHTSRVYNSKAFVPSFEDTRMLFTHGKVFDSMAFQPLQDARVVGDDAMPGGDGEALEAELDRYVPDVRSGEQAALGNGATTGVGPHGPPGGNPGGLLRNLSRHHRSVDVLTGDRINGDAVDGHDLGNGHYHLLHQQEQQQQRQRAQGMPSPSLSARNSAPQKGKGSPGDNHHWGGAGDGNHRAAAAAAPVGHAHGALAGGADVGREVADGGDVGPEKRGVARALALAAGDLGLMSAHVQALSLEDLIPRMHGSEAKWDRLQEDGATEEAEPAGDEGLGDTHMPRGGMTSWFAKNAYLRPKDKEQWPPPLHPINDACLQGRNSSPSILTPEGSYPALEYERGGRQPATSSESPARKRSCCSCCGLGWFRRKRRDARLGDDTLMRTQSDTLNM